MSRYEAFIVELQTRLGSRRPILCIAFSFLCRTSVKGYSEYEGSEPAEAEFEDSESEDGYDESHPDGDNDNNNDHDSSDDKQEAVEFDVYSKPCVYPARLRL